LYVKGGSLWEIIFYRQGDLLPEIDPIIDPGLDPGLIPPQ